MKIWILRIFLLTAAFFHPVFSWSQETVVTGKVRSDGVGLQFATVQIKEEQIGTTTDMQGVYQLSGLAPGTYELTVSFLGHIPLRKKIMVGSRDRIELDFDLQPFEALQEIVVTGNMKPTYISSSPIKIEVVTARQLDTYLPAAASSIIESAQLVNGLQEVVDCGICQTNNISVNGLPGSYTAILMDGTPIYGSLASVYGLNGIPNMIIDRFEVIRGPNSTLYGSEAVAGVINVITKDPEDQPTLSTDLMTSSHKELFSNLALTYSIGKTNAYLGVNYNYSDHYQDVNDDGFGDGILSDRLSLFTKFQIFRKSGKIFSIAGKYYFEDRRNGVKAFVNDRAYKKLRGSSSVYGESIYTNRTELFGTYAMNSRADIKIDYSFSDHRQDSYYGSDYYEARQQIAFGNLVWNMGWANHELLLGATLRFDAYDDNTVATEKENQLGEIVNQPNNQFVPGLFAQDQYHYSEKFIVLAGMRLDRHADHGLIFSPRLNLKLKVSEWTTLRFNFGTGFKVVNLFTEDHAFVQGQRDLVITEKLDPEKSYNLSLNLYHVYTGLGGSGTIEFESFYTHFTNKIIPDYGTSGKIIYSNSDGHAKSAGLSMNVSHNFGFPLSLNLGLNFLQSTQTYFDKNRNTIEEDLLFSPRLSGILSANYRIARQRVTLAYTLQYTGKMKLPEVYDLDSDGQPLPHPRSTISKPFSLHQLQVTKELTKNYSLYFGINNVFNLIQRESPLVGYDDPNHAPGFSPYFDTSYAYAPNQGRELYLGFRWNLPKNNVKTIAER